MQWPRVRGLASETENVAVEVHVTREGVYFNALVTSESKQRTFTSTEQCPLRTM